LEKFTVLVVGHGKLAEELLQGLCGDTIARVARWEDRESMEGDPCMVVHAGSGSQLDDVIGFCSENGSILLQLSTGDSRFPGVIRFPVVVCLNVNMPMLYFMAMVKHASRYFKGLDIQISESHQASKRTKPGTAIYLANSLGVPESEIRSERDPKIQQEVLGIPSSSLGRHAVHRIVITNPEMELRMETRVLGKSAYASGLSKIIDMVTQSEMSPGIHDIVDLFINGMQTRA
jgi:hypothetical protein